MPPEKIISRARAQLATSNSSQGVFFATLLFHLVPTPTRRIRTAATDGHHLFYNPKWVAKLVEEALSKEGQATADAYVQAVLLHEVLHCALLHLFRGPKEVQEARKGSGPGPTDAVRAAVRIWNMACNYAANQILVDAGYRLPGNPLVNERFRGMSAEEIYRILRAEEFPELKQEWGEHSLWPIQGGRKASVGADGSDSDVPESSSGSGTPGETDADEGGAAASAASEARGGGGEEAAGSEYWGIGDLERAAEEWRIRVIQAARAAEASRRGDLPVGLKRIVDKALEPKVDWRRALWSYLRPTRADYDWLPPDRRAAWRKAALPDLGGETLEDIVIAVDTSGSISDDSLKQFFGEITMILQTFPNLRGHILACDAKVHAHVEIGEGFALSPEFFRGGGGTDFRPVFEWVDKHVPDPVCVVYLTDGDGYVQKDPPPYPVLWVLHGAYRKRPECGWGEVVEID